MRNLSKNMETRVKSCVYKSLILPLNTFASSIWHPLRGRMRLMECFQKRSFKWTTGYRNAPYFENTVSLRLLPLPMFLQRNDLLLLSKLYHDKENALPWKLLKSSVFSSVSRQSVFKAEGKCALTLIETYEHQYGSV